jgi:glycosyltransferase involved in cell wall biosynthesis
MKNKSAASVVIVSHFAPFPPRAGNEYRLSRLILWLHEKGFHVTLVVRPMDALTPEQRNACRAQVSNFYVFPLRQARTGLFQRMVAWPTVLATRIRAHLQNKRLTLEERQQLSETQALEDRFAPTRFVGFVRNIIRQQRPSIVIAEYVFTSRVLLGLPKKILKIIDTHDLFSTKKEKVIDLGVDDPLHLSRPAEAALLRRADLVLAIQQQEREALCNMVPDRAVVNLGVDFPIKLSPRKATGNIPFSEACNLLMVASDNALNRRGLQELLDHAWPGIVSAAPHVRLRVVGKVAEGMQFNQPNLDAVGPVDDLDSEYAQADIVLNPVRAGTGLKIKSVEAVCHGKPLISFPNGVDGFTHDEAMPFIVVDSWQDFAQAVIALSHDPVHREQLAGHAESYAMRYFSKAPVFSEFETFLRSNFP